MGAPFSAAHDVPAPEEETFEIAPLLVVASPLPRSADDYAVLASAIRGHAALASGSTNLGQSLESLTGVQQTGFAPGAGRPVIRGFTGSRIQILEDGMSVLDVSALSDDHAVGETAVFSRQIEVLRGPATLLYGGNAIGGVVNVVSEPAPAAPQPEPARADTVLRYNEGSDGWLRGAQFTAGSRQWAVRVTGVAEGADDYRVPDAFIREHDEHEDEDEHVDEHSETLDNSFADREQYDLGVSWFGNDGRISVSVSQLEALYGVPGHHHPHEHEDPEPADENADHEDVRVDLKSRSGSLTWDQPLDHGFFQRVRSSFSYTEYAHQELEGETTGTRFERTGWELRSEWTHGSVKSHHGIIGLHLQDDAFRAIGEEAFTPPTDERRAGLFWVLEQESAAPFAWSHGARIDYIQIDAESKSRRHFWLGSASSSVRWDWSDTDSLALQLALSQRAPSGSALYADGPHLASGRYERGHPQLDPETALGLDLTYRKELERLDLTAATYLYRFFDYIHDRPTDREIDGLPLFIFEQTDALIGGLELEATAHLLHDGPTRAHVTLGFDWTHREAIQTDEALPRNPPARIRASLHLEQNLWSVDATIRHVFAQDHLAPHETLTDAHTMFDLLVSVRLPDVAKGARIFVRGNNLTDELGFNHLAYRKEEKPLPGRSFSAGLQVSF